MHCVAGTGALEREPHCAKCGAVDKISQPKSKPHTYWCGNCRNYFTVTTGTIMHSTKTPLQNWIVAIYSVMTARKGISAMQLSKELGVQYRTAWYMLHRIREACASGEFRLDNIVEMDEAYIGGKEAAKHADKKLRAGSGCGRQDGGDRGAGARRQDGCQAGRERRQPDGHGIRDRDREGRGDDLHRRLPASTAACPSSIARSITAQANTGAARFTATGSRAYGRS